MTGFRVSRAGWFGLDGVRPDLLTFGKVMGGGFPAAAFGGRADVMARLAPAGPVYQAGTLSGNPIATAAGLATLRHATDDVYAHVDAVAASSARCVSSRCPRPASPHRLQYAGQHVLGLLLPTGRCVDYDAAQAPGGVPLHGVLPRDARAGRLPAAVARSSRGSCPPRTTTRRSPGSPTRCPHAARAAAAACRRTT